MAGIVLLYVGVPIAVLSILSAIWMALKGYSPRVALKVLATTVLLPVLFYVTVQINGFAQNYAVAAAKSYPAQVAPYLEAYRQSHGVYPTTLDQLPSAPSAPRLLQKDGYHSDGQTYEFWFGQPGGMIDVWSYDNKTRQWHLST